MSIIKEKADRFWNKVDMAKLTYPASRICDIAEDELGTRLEDIIDEYLARELRPECRIRYESAKESRDGKEKYIFEIRRSKDENYGFMCSFDLQNDMIHYTALTEVRELLNMGYDVHF